MRWRMRRRHEHETRGPAADPADGDLVTIDAGQVTLTGPLGEVRRAVAVGLYGQPGNPTPMSQEEDHVMTGVYIGVGVLLAAGAGYLAWRYLLSDDQKNSVKDAVADGATKAKRAVRDAKGKLVA